MNSSIFNKNLQITLVDQQTIWM